MQYKEIIKRIQKEIWVFHQIKISIKINFPQNLADETIKNILYYETTNNKENDVDDNLYYHCYYPENQDDTIKINIDIIKITITVYDFVCSPIYVYFGFTYESFSSLIITHNIDTTFHVPGYDMPIINPLLFINFDDILFLVLMPLKY